MKPLYAGSILISACLCAAELSVLPEWSRADPLHPAAAAREISLAGARGSFVSCQLQAVPGAAGPYSISVDAKGLQADLFREWFHWTPPAKAHIPDALIPVSNLYRATLPDPDNKIDGQRAQAFWLDVWIPRETTPGKYAITAKLEPASGGAATALISVDVLNVIAPERDAIAIDHNTYGTSWMFDQYRNPEVYKLIHAYHRIIYEHHGVFHQLGYGHAGKVGPEFAPVLAGTGKSKHVVDWTQYDRHYGPLLDGSAFATTHRGQRPIPFVYLPINPEWPASYLWWGEPGYEREFVNVVSEMERHFREKGWTQTRFELFFNHKKRYKGFSWDGDEARFPADYAFMKEYARLMKAAVPSESPVKFVFRADVSWTMERQFRDLAGVVNFWVCGGGMFGWYRGAAETLKSRGDIVWTYGGTPPVTQPLSHMTTDPLRTWLWAVDGYVRWLTTDPGKDPWFNFQGGGEALVYPGDRFGIAEPIPSMRLKVQRNAVQDINLLDAMRGSRAEVARRFNDTALEEWWTPRPKLADTDPLEWNNTDIDEATPRPPKFANIDADAWRRVRAYVIELAAKEAR
jgi:hypothetical protein